ncbi:hypothetical protein MBCUT_15750 [Methanobrevibacter cuticularis]|uniref:Uncharacterized protein n=1 Tax=Methanobrevibacter cuticularis TaxID=47311 RepID=A0A166D865_9EURY|nr:DUF5750 family protein [Methanobrevibacter cuticularis]KZX15306.1 hypothetical protein MBCUT_15750 [Methanobrevibacter cuticularis]
MKVKVEDYGPAENMGDNRKLSYITYKVSDIDSNSLKFLNENLEGKTEIINDSLHITILYDNDMFPFQSEEAKLKMSDFKAREEIEMTIFLSSFLEDM